MKIQTTRTKTQDKENMGKKSSRVIEIQAMRNEI